MQEWLCSFTEQQILVAKEMHMLAEMVDKMPSDFNNEQKARTMISTAQMLIGSKNAQDEEEDKSQRMWNDLDHRFSSHPRLVVQERN